jgi:hypothetical protein
MSSIPEPATEPFTDPDQVPENPDPAGEPGWGEPPPDEDDPTHNDQPE